MVFYGERTHVEEFPVLGNGDEQGPHKRVSGSGGVNGVHSKPGHLPLVSLQREENYRKRDISLIGKR